MKNFEKKIIAHAKAYLDERTDEGRIIAIGMLGALLEIPTDEDRDDARAIAQALDNKEPEEVKKFYGTDLIKSAEKTLVKGCPECGRPKRHKQICTIGKAAKREKKEAKREKFLGNQHQENKTVDPYPVSCDDCAWWGMIDIKFIDATCKQCGGIHLKKMSTDQQ